ncbi:MAG: M13 family metallopeptidase [Lachnospiraceae bacterium]|nr:M13 family metallopeptidase [Lachnospiraceae bacterium]
MRKHRHRHTPMRRVTALILAVLLALAALAGCGASTDDPAAFAQGDQWIDSDILGSITENDEFRLQDDFAAAANKEWILSEGAVIKDGKMDHIADIVNDKKVALLTDDSVTGKEAEELKKYGALASDWDYRAKTGIEPLRPYIESIGAISSIDEFYAWVTDPEKNPLGIGPVEVQAVSMRLKAYPDEMTVQYSAPDFSLGDSTAYYNLLGDALEKKEVTEQKVSYLLGRLGYPESDIDRILKENYALEKKLGSIVSPEDTSEDADLKMTDAYEDLVAAAGSYPLDKFMKAWGYDNVKHMLGDKKYLKKVSGVCTEANLPGLKSMLTVGYVLKLGKLLDRDAYDTFVELSKSRSSKERPNYKSDADKDRDLLCASIAESGLIAAMDKLYLEKYIDKEEAEELSKLTDDIIDIYRTEIFPNEDWLSEEGKAACIDKLNAITKNVIYPDMSVVDYSTLDIVPKEEGGTFLEAYLESMRYLGRMKAQKAGTKYEREDWYPYEAQISTTDTNSVYRQDANSINIYAGMLEDPAYHKGMSREELLSGIGAVIGHEITHGFDSGGVKYDKDGIKNQWLPESDQQAFNDRAERVSSFYTLVQPFKGSGFYDSGKVVGEAVADMGGLKAVLTLASKETDFDYDRFFRHYALLWAAQYSPELEQWLFKNDVHPLNVYRINVDVQQYEEFYKTYDVHPDDKMYLDEKKRILVW